MQTTSNRPDGIQSGIFLYFFGASIFSLHDKTFDMPFCLTARKIQGPLPKASKSTLFFHGLFENGV